MQTWLQNYGSDTSIALALKEYHGESEIEDIRKKTIEIEKNNPHASLMAVNGLNHGKDRLFITFYESYTAHSKAMKLTREIPFVNIENIETFLVDLEDKTNYRLLSLAEIAKHLLKKKQRLKPNISAR